jgi:hypothetical protein
MPMWVARVACGATAPECGYYGVLNNDAMDGTWALRTGRLRTETDGMGSPKADGIRKQPVMMFTPLVDDGGGGPGASHRPSLALFRSLR